MRQCNCEQARELREKIAQLEKQIETLELGGDSHPPIRSLGGYHHPQEIIQDLHDEQDMRDDEG